MAGLQYSYYQLYTIIVVAAMTTTAKPTKTVITQIMRTPTTRTLTMKRQAINSMCASGINDSKGRGGCLGWGSKLEPGDS